MLSLPSQVHYCCSPHSSWTAPAEVPQAAACRPAAVGRFMRHVFWLHSPQVRRAGCQKAAWYIDLRTDAADSAFGTSGPHMADLHSQDAAVAPQSLKWHRWPTGASASVTNLTLTRLITRRRAGGSAWQVCPIEAHCLRVHRQLPHLTGEATAASQKACRLCPECRRQPPKQAGRGKDTCHAMRTSSSTSSAR